MFETTNQIHTGKGQPKTPSVDVATGFQLMLGPSRCTGTWDDPKRPKTIGCVDMAKKLTFFNGKKKRGGSGHTWSYYIKSIFIYISCLTCTIVLSKTTSKPAFPFPSRVPELQSPRRGLWRCGFLGVQRLPAFLLAVKPWTTMVLP